MIDRRAFVSLSAALPLTDTRYRQYQAQSSVEQLDTGEVQILGLSPDTSTLVGQRDREQLVFLDTATLDVVSSSEPSPDLSFLETSSICWNPAGTLVAFSLDAWKLGSDSDIFVANASTGEIINLTPEQTETETSPFINNPDALVDVFPAWLDDETLVFSRHQFHEDNISVDLVTLNVSEKDPEPRFDLATHDLLFVSSPIHHVSNSRLVMVTDSVDRQGRVTIVNAEGDVSFLELPFVEYPELNDTNDTHCLVLNPTVGSIWMVQYDDPKTAMDINDLFELEAGTPWKSIPIFGEEPDSVLFVAGDDSRVFIRTADSTRDLGTLPDGEVVIRSYWAESTAILVGSSSTWKIDTT